MKLLFKNSKASIYTIQHPCLGHFSETKLYYKIVYAGRISFSCYVHGSRSFASNSLLRFTKHNTSKTYTEVTISILFSLNFYLPKKIIFFIPVINLITFFWICTTYIHFLVPPERIMPYLSSDLKQAKWVFQSIWLLRMFFEDMIV